MLERLQHIQYYLSLITSINTHHYFYQEWTWCYYYFYLRHSNPAHYIYRLLQNVHLIHFKLLFRSISFQSLKSNKPKAHPSFLKGEHDIVHISHQRHSCRHQPLTAAACRLDFPFPKHNLLSFI